MEQNREAILTWFDSSIFNEPVESINNFAQTAKANAHGVEPA